MAKHLAVFYKVETTGKTIPFGIKFSQVERVIGDTEGKTKIYFVNGKKHPPILVDIEALKAMEMINEGSEEPIGKRKS